jgi:hypothetical protein
MSAAMIILVDLLAISNLLFRTGQSLCRIYLFTLVKFTAQPINTGVGNDNRFVSRSDRGAVERDIERDTVFARYRG